MNCNNRLCLFLLVRQTGKQYVLAGERVTMNRMIENGDEIDDANFPKVSIGVVIINVRHFVVIVGHRGAIG